jgi:hypothetical protein
MRRISFLFCFLIAQITHARILNDSLPPGNNYDKAAFRLWYADSVKEIKGVVVLMPGSNDDGREMAESKFWQGFAEQHNFALLACYYTDKPHDNMGIEDYVNVKDGSGQALLDILKKFAESSNHNEIEGVPLLLWGHSAGGEFNYEFACWKPERVMAFVVNKGGVYYSAIASPNTRNVPGLFFTGEKDKQARTDIVKGLWSMNRRFGALWCYAQEPGVGHDESKTPQLGVKFFEAVIATYNTRDEKKGYIGDEKTKTVFPYSEWQRVDYPQSWLPTKEFAEAWLVFIEGK